MLIYYQVKITLKNNFYHILKHTLKACLETQLVTCFKIFDFF